MKARVRVHVSPPISKDEFRRILSRFATGVTVVTVARAEGRTHGMTANAFSSVSLDPPLVLVCIDRDVRTHPLLLTCERFGVNVLRENQQAVAEYYADVREDHETPQHLGVRYHRTERGTPMLDPCLAQLECRLAATHEAGDHTIVVAEVEYGVIGQGQPLLFYGGEYRSLAADTS